MIGWNSYSAERFLKIEESDGMTRRQANDQRTRP